MRPKYDILFITTMPSFYKVNLFNEIAKQLRIMVVYTGSNEGIRSNDFCSVKANYDNHFLSNNKFRSLFQIFKILLSSKFSRAIVSGWDNIISFVVVLLHKKSQNGCIVESSINESVTHGIKARLKRFLLNRVSTVYTSGTSQRLLAEALGYKGKIVEFGGCGILNYVPQPPFNPRNEVRNFLYVGRIAKVKNLSLLVSVFNEMPHLNLIIVGDGPLRESLENEANHNIHFVGAVNNTELPQYYKEADVFVLTSLSEPWGLVVEEALNNGTPVIVSSAVGCADSIVTPYSSGIVFDSDSKESLEKSIALMCEIDFYNQIRFNISKIDFAKRAKQQVESFIR